MKNEWKEAVIEACVINCIDWYEDDPIKTLYSLIDIEVKMALDPSISPEARALIERGKNSK